MSNEIFKKNIYGLIIVANIWITTTSEYGMVLTTNQSIGHLEQKVQDNNDIRVLEI